MTLLRWAETDRETLRRILPEALVVLPLGATEQHGPHLPTGTDALLAATVAERAAERAAPASSRPLVLAPPLPFGASDHHLPFGGTLSLTPETLLQVLLDLLRSVAAAGGRRLLLVNGHGGNTGVCHAAAAAAAARHDLTVAHLDYWHVATEGGQVPGHAGEFETSLMLAVRPELVRAPTPRGQAPQRPDVPGVQLHAAQVWRAIDGYTDHPERADADGGRRRLDQLTAALAERLQDLARTL